MNKPENYCKGGPSYLEQMYDGYINYYDKEDPMYIEQFSEIWDNCMILCENVHNERIRNKLSPITNLISIVENLLDDPNNSLVNKIINNEKLMRQCIESSNKAVKQLLDIPNQ